MNLSKLLILISAFLLVVTFQNCNDQTYLDPNNPMDNELLNGNSVSVGTPSEVKFNLRPLSLPTIGIPNQNAVINLENGQVNVDGFNNPLCIPDDFLKELKGILNSSEICPAVVPDPEMMCAMVYEFPYTVLVYEDGNEISLGEKVSSCQLKTHLCSPNKDLLKTYLSKVAANIDQFACDEAL